MIDFPSPRAGGFLIVDDHEVTRRGTRQLLSDAFPEFGFGEAANADELTAAVHRCRWDLVILDIRMPGGDVLANLARVRAVDEQVPVLIFTGIDEIEYAVQTMKRGAQGFLYKHDAGRELVEVVRTLLAGGTYVHPDVAREITQSVLSSNGEPPHRKLSEREYDILCHIARGQAVKAIGVELGISDKTVATYISRIRQKTGLDSYVDMARYALQHRLVD